MMGIVVFAECLKRMYTRLEQLNNYISDLDK